MSLDDDKKFINYVPISVKTHSYLIKRANQMGFKLNEYLGMIADSHASSETPEMDNDNPHVRFFWNQVLFSRKKARYDQLFRMATVYQQMGEQESDADTIQEQCQLIGMDMGDLMDQVGQDPLSTIVAQAKNGTKTIACLLWLSRTLRMLGGSAPTSVLETLAEKEGYQKQMLDRVRKRIRNDHSCDTVINSRKEGKYWIWYFASKETGNAIEFPGAQEESEIRRTLRELGIED